MKKSEMMIEFEQETGQTLEEADERGITLNFYLKYIQWLEAKAAPYDRLMSGGKKTLKEWANILQMCTAVNSQGEGWASNYKLEIDGSGWWPFNAPIKIHLNTIPAQFIDFSGDWKTSLTFPDNWEAPNAKD